uniref:hypothetical protein n=1 Tax=uncultured Allobacillus sp. TaxID=1638025 RepID=UPI002598432E|nr:hypothetical protein [uncultured Allobacillus sp.]
MSEKKMLFEDFMRTQKKLLKESKMLFENIESIYEQQEEIYKLAVEFAQNEFYSHLSKEDVNLLVSEEFNEFSKEITMSKKLVDQLKKLASIETDDFYKVENKDDVIKLIIASEILETEITTDSIIDLEIDIEELVDIYGEYDKVQNTQLFMSRVEKLVDNYFEDALISLRDLFDFSDFSHIDIEDEA